MRFFNNNNNNKTLIQRIKFWDLTLIIIVIIIIYILNGTSLNPSQPLIT